MNDFLLLCPVALPKRDTPPLSDRIFVIASSRDCHATSLPWYNCPSPVCHSPHYEALTCSVLFVLGWPVKTFCFGQLSGHSSDWFCSKCECHVISKWWRYIGVEINSMLNSATRGMEWVDFRILCFYVPVSNKYFCHCPCFLFEGVAVLLPKKNLIWVHPRRLRWVSFHELTCWILFRGIFRQLPCLCCLLVEFNLCCFHRAIVCDWFRKGFVSCRKTIPSPLPTPFICGSHLLDIHRPRHDSF